MPIVAAGTRISSSSVPIYRQSAPPNTYAPTEFEDEVHELDLATAMAVSGRGASSNMGANSIKALTPTLAILNVRLGYWVANPRQLALARKPPILYSPNSISCRNCWS
jgi:hypothetical protein